MSDGKDTFFPSLDECRKLIDDYAYYGGPPLETSREISRLSRLISEMEEVKRSLNQIRERASEFAKPKAEGKQRKSAVATCTWIAAEIDRLGERKR